MTIRELINYMSAESNISLTKLALKMGYKRVTNITSMFYHRDGFTVRKFSDICDAFGYELIVRKKRDTEYFDTDNGIRVTKEKDF